MNEMHDHSPPERAERIRRPIEQVLRRTAVGLAVAFACFVFSGVTIGAADDPAPVRKVERAVPVKDGGGAFVRRGARDDDTSVLEIASRRYRKPGGAVDVSLVGVVHLATPEYYRAVQSHLDEHALVLYESVIPRGAVLDAAANGADPVRATRDSMLFLRRVMLDVRELDATADGGAGSTPSTPSINDALAKAHRVDSRFEPWARQASADAWGRPIELEAHAGGAFLLISRGADGEQGGEALDADIRLRTPKDRRSSADPGAALQPQLASLLGLSFQLDAVDYHRANWVVADMGERQLIAELEERGIDGGPLMQALSGSNMTAGLANAAVALIRIADGFTGGRVRAFVKFVLIETLSMVDEKTISRGMPGGFAEVILHRRNDVAYDALRERLAAPEPPTSIAVFYGAAHMPELERWLIDEGWIRTDEQWFEAIAVNPKAVGLDPAMVSQLRAALRETLRQMGQEAEEP